MKKLFFMFVISLLIFGPAGGFYLTNFFLPDSMITTDLGDIEVGNKNKGFLEDSLIRQASNFKVDLIDIDDNIHTLTLDDFCDIIEDNVSNVINSKTYLEWTKSNYIDVKEYCFVNNDKIIKALASIRPIKTVSSKSAEIIYDSEKIEYVIEPEVYGNEYINDLDKVLSEHLVTGENQLNLFDLGCYLMPNVLKDDIQLNANMKEMNSYLDTVVTFTFGDKSEIIDKTVFSDWLTFDKESDKINAVLDEDVIKEYAKNIVDKYSTVKSNRAFLTSTGETVQLQSGSYGWKLDEKFIVDTLTNCLLNRISDTYEFEYLQTAQVKDINDLGNSYVEVSIENQRVWMYINGECIVDTPVVTGWANAGHHTTKGVYFLNYKARNQTLRGWNDDGTRYASFVNYWMPFNGGIGLHDATWRSVFGGTIYKNDGSHGCVNMPLKAAKTVYENINSTMPIIVW